MKKWLKRLAMLLAVIILATVVLVAIAWWKTAQGLARTYVVNDPPLTLARDPETMARGAHLFATRGCADCHGADGAGKLVFDAGPVIRLVAPNITPGGVVKGISGDQIAAAIRHGVKPDGHPMLFMPSSDFKNFSDTDTAALVAYMQSLAASGNDPGPTEIRPLGRVLYLFGKFPLLPAETIDHTPRARSAPAVAATAEYGQYLAQGCTGCHGHDFAGQHVPGTPPEFPDAQNLTPANLGAWSNEDFRRALRTGKRPDGSVLKDFMPWRTFAKLSDTEIDALYVYLRTVPSVQTPVKR
jgi:mono/diheme cytochrome c family protein